jgi:hypothetical protein
MTGDQTNIPNIAEMLSAVLRKIDPKQQPLLLAKLERFAARRYRVWASDQTENSISQGLLACADREEEIARRVESLTPDAAAIQDKLLAENPELLNVNRTLFEGRPIQIQFAMQADGERAGAAAWKAYAAAASDKSAQELLHGCSALEQANADFLQTLL